MTIADTLVLARRERRVLPQWPGALPESIEAAYALQAQAVAGWGAPLAGYKVGLMDPARRAATGVDRWLGPVFAPALRPATVADDIAFDVLPGVAGFECEIVMELARDLPGEAPLPDGAALPDVIGDCRIAIEITGCPVAGIGALGSFACIAAFGNAHALIVGPSIAGWRDIDLDTLPVRAEADGANLRAATPAALPGGVWAALASALVQAQRHGLPLRSGMVISTGAITGLHPISAGARITADFGARGALRGCAAS